MVFERQAAGRNERIITQLAAGINFLPWPDNGR
jgi:hypothetical protein